MQKNRGDKMVEKLKMTAEKDKYKYFTVSDVIYFMDNNNKCPFVWNGEACTFDLKSRKFFVNVKDGFYDNDNIENNDLQVWVTAKLGGMQVPCVLNVNDFRFVINVYERNRNYRQTRTIDLSEEWCTERLAQHGLEYKEALKKEFDERKTMEGIKTDEEVGQLLRQIESIQNKHDDEVVRLSKKLDKILDKAVERKHKTGSAAMQVLNSKKQNVDDLTESNKDLIDAVYGAGYYDYVLGEKSKKVEAPSKNEVKEDVKAEKPESVTKVVFGYDHDEVIERNGK